MTKKAGERLFEAVGQIPEEIILEAARDGLQEMEPSGSPEESEPDSVLAAPKLSALKNTGKPAAEDPILQAGKKQQAGSARLDQDKQYKQDKKDKKAKEEEKHAGSSTGRTARPGRIGRYLPAAACLCIFLAGIFLVINNRKTNDTAKFSVAFFNEGGTSGSSGNSDRSDSADAGAESAQETADAAGMPADSSGVDAKQEAQKPVRYDAYEGPVFALTATGDTQKLKTVRKIKAAAAEDAKEGAVRPLVDVVDSCRIKNMSEEDKTLQLVYPFVSTLNLAYDMEGALMQIQGQDDVSPSYNIGDGVSAYLYQDPYRTASLEDYQNLSDENADYFDHALEKAVDWNQEVNVYTFSKTGGQEEAPYDGSPGVIGVTVYGEQADVLTYGFDYSAVREGGASDYCFFVPEAYEQVYLIVTGEQAGEPELGFYANLDCEETLEDIPCAMERQSMPYADALKLCAQAAVKQLEQDYAEGVYKGNLPEYLNQDTAYQALTVISGEKEFYDTLLQRYQTAELKEIYQVLFAETRVVYAMATVTIPAQQSIQVTVRTQKRQGGGYYTMQSDETDKEYRYDLMAQAESHLNIVRASCTVELSDRWELTDDNMGLKQEKSVWRAQLKDKCYYYKISEYLESKTTSKNN